MKESNSFKKPCTCSFYQNGFIAIAIGSLFFVMDLLTKYYTQALLPLATISAPIYPYGGFAVFENFYGIQFSINHTVNMGAAWGIFKDYPEVLLVLRFIMVLGLIIYTIFYNKFKSHYIPLALIISGAIGNILDHFLYGHVIDMFHFNFWGFDYAVFNVADSSIFLGVVWLFILSFKCSNQNSPKDIFNNAKN